MSIDGRVDLALARTSECAEVDFKSSFDANEAGEWLELLKDIVAFANSGGGSILVGINDDGTPSGSDVSSFLSTDPADVTNKINKYAGIQFHDFEIVETAKDGCEVGALVIGPARVPIVFCKAGTYPAGPDNRQQERAFSSGCVYFRHGAKSEPGNSEDLRCFVEREVERLRKSWLEGIAKVVEAPAGSRIAILPPANEPTGAAGSMPLRLTDDPAAPAYFALPLDETHPHRAMEVASEVNRRLRGKKLGTHHIVWIRRVFEIQKNIVFCYTQKHVSPRYSEAFVDWIVEQLEANEKFLGDCKVRYDELKRKA